MKIFFALCLVSSVLRAAPNYPTPEGYVTDAAGVLDGASRESLESQLAEFERTTTHSLVVVTVPSLDGETVETYANELFKRSGVGWKGQDNGLLILVAPNDRLARIEVGYGLEAALPDGLTGQIVRENMLPAFREKQYAAGLADAVRSIESVLTRGAPAPPARRSPRAGINVMRSHAQLIMLAIFFAIALGGPATFCSLILAILGFLMLSTLLGVVLIPLGFFLDLLFFRRRRSSFMRPGGHWGGGFGGGGFGGGGWSGGGGFGGFGGGSSGGGGASGRW